MQRGQSLFCNIVLDNKGQRPNGVVCIVLLNDCFDLLVFSYEQRLALTDLGDVKTHFKGVNELRTSHNVMRCQVYSSKKHTNYVTEKLVNRVLQQSFGKSKCKMQCIFSKW